jgi:hypothetical protein
MNLLISERVEKSRNEGFGFTFCHRSGWLGDYPEPANGKPPKTQKAAPEI